MITKEDAISSSFLPLFTSERIDSAFKKYLKCFESQSQVLQNGGRLRHFSNLFASLPSLQKVQLLDDCGAMAKENLRCAADLDHFHIVT
jgi:hypothetical protein